MNANQDKREEEKKQAIADNIQGTHDKMKRNLRFVLNSGCVLEVLEEVLNEVPLNYEVREVFVQQVAMQTSKLQIPKRQPQIVTFYYPLLEKINSVQR